VDETSGGSRGPRNSYLARRREIEPQLSWSQVIHAMKPSFPGIVIAISFLMVSPSALLAAEREVHWGEARNEQGELVYREKHSVTGEGGQVLTSLTEYINPDGQVIATMESDYSRNLSMPTYVFEDRRSGHREGLREENGEYVIFIKKRDGEEKTAAITNTENVFSCQGWHYYLVNNLSELERGNVELNLILPSQLKALPFEIQQVRAEGDRVEAILKFNHWFFRYFSPTLRLVYDSKLKKLVEYRGISNIVDDDGNRQEVRIVYRY
jgi:hypothetical protein